MQIQVAVEILLEIVDSVVDKVNGDGGTAFFGIADQNEAYWGLGYFAGVPQQYYLVENAESLECVVAVRSVED